MVTMHTDKRDEALLEEIAQMFEVYASDSEAFASRNLGKRENLARARVWRDAAADLRSIRITKEAAK